MEDKFLGPEKEWLVQHSLDILKKEKIDYFIYGHRHLPIDYPLGVNEARYINLGDWLVYNSYAVFDGNDLQLNYYKPGKS